MGENSNDTMLEKVNLKDGRIYFPNVQIFQSYYANLKDVDENEVANILESRYYSKGFYSLKPILSKSNEESQSIDGSQPAVGVLGSGGGNF